ncbi:MAG TPA: HD-GYP domain-containing protein [Candidatus Eisenbacteria bacterium]|jgi:putative nucleotidyltransferase with HDIG domain
MANTTVAPPHTTWFRSVRIALVMGVAVALVLLRPSPSPLPWFAWLIALPFLTLGEDRSFTDPFRSRISMTGAVDFACLILLGPVPTAWLDLISTAISQGWMRRRPWPVVVYDMAAISSTALAAGYSFLLAGGRVGRLDFPRDLGPLLTCGAVYWLGHSLLALASPGSKAEPGPWQTVRRALPGAVLVPFSFLALGVLAAVAVVQAGLWGLLAFAVPFLLARYWRERYVELRADLKDFVRALSEVLEEVDPWTRQHSARVSQYAVRLARELGRPERDVQDIEWAALIHDLGKIGPQNQHLLHKPGTLSHEEQRTLRGHPEVGADIVARIRALRRAGEIIRFHHERPDGRGYPLGLRSESVPIGARILNVADAFDAMTSDRPYRRALSPEAAVRELERGADSQFDRPVVEALLRLRRRGRFELIPSPGSEALRALKMWPSRAQG